ncbi:S8 family serine peptidase [Luteolibacter ambystomatis]|uniref:S8 family serine peptidase n=1 Tax=Luteolibacter ambystomatis TaxID=2824561 RepID=A0A975IZH5_9BACT|nr:S8 family serine peptidase [Luteolibacter ambystomatis]QUE49695.1 S8 family serine peptidase [Luteolibacter ambystomatis]
MRAPRWILIPLFLAVCTAGGYLLVRSAKPQSAPKKAASTPEPMVYHDSEAPAFRSGDRKEARPKGDVEALSKGALAGQRSVTFKDRASMEAFLEKIKGKGIAVMGRLDAINTLRLGFLSADELASVLDGSEKTGFIFPVMVPGLPEGSIQPGAVPLGNRLAEWLGIAGYDRSTWGKGLNVAVLDTGISTMASFFGKVNQSALVDFSADASGLNGHGTAVASIINGIAPEANILSYRIADDNGMSNSGLIAEGILKAVADGASVINISLGGFGDSLVLRQAVEYAQQHGVAIVAATGNNGIDQIAQPASISGVIGVGAVDANGDHLLFSNTGKQISSVAPGYGVAAEGVDGSVIYFSGTSASAPIETGALLAAMSNSVLSGNLSSGDASALLTSLLDESGAPGFDTQYGNGAVDLGRVMISGTRNLTDAAMASQWVTTNENGQQILQITVQNRGTNTLTNVPVMVNTPDGTASFNVGSLGPTAIQTFEVPIRVTDSAMTFQSSIGNAGGQKDINTANNSRRDVYTPASAQ